MKWFILSIVIMMAGAGAWAFFLGASGFYSTGMFLVKAGKKVPGKFVEYHTEVSLEPNTFTDNNRLAAAVNSYPIFEYRSDAGYKRKIKSDQKHLFQFYNPGDKIKVWESGSSHVKPRIAGFYSLFFLDLLTTVIGLLFIIVPISLYSSFSSTTNHLDHEINSIQNEVVIVDRPGVDHSEERNDVENYVKGVEEGKPQNLTRLITQLFLGTGIPKYIKFMLWFMVITTILSLFMKIPSFWKHFIFEFTPPGQFIRAIHNNDQAYVDKYLEHGWGINWRDSYEQNALLAALDRKNTKLARKLIEMGAEVNFISKFNTTPLDLAVMNGEADLVKLLLEKGARIDLCETYPLIRTVKQRNLEILQALINGGADLSIQYNTGHGNKTTILQFAVKSKWDEGADLIEAAHLGFSK